MGEYLKNEVAARGIAHELDIFGLDAGLYEVLDRRKSFSKLTGKSGIWYEVLFPRSARKEYRETPGLTVGKNGHANLDVSRRKF